ncbi:MAG TPA: cation-transporting P-type ATPase, partial [Bacteroidota bacterium]|nr:cation-transporting P-type ATPase [Bacteroidota bacterium]
MRTQTLREAASKIVTPSGKGAARIHVSAEIIEAARTEAVDVLQKLNSTTQGLSESEQESRRETYGPNEVVQEVRHGWPRRLLSTLRNPLVVLLSALAVISLATGDIRAAVVMGLMVVLGVMLKFVQETRADSAAAQLKAMIKVTATVIREGNPLEIPLKELVPGDVVKLSAGDMIPADLRVVSSKDLFLIQASLTGESLPIEKFDAKETREDISPLEFSNICFLGTSVESGTALGAVVSTGKNTYFGSMAGSIAGQQIETSFDKGIKRFTWLMIRFMMVMVPLVFVINGLTKGNWTEAFFFALAVAVGLTPEMLPMIVSVSLSKGAMLMSRKKVIVKRLNSIQNFGAMDVLCTDKTGTLT